jgi:hypothetical protein
MFAELLYHCGLEDGIDDNGSSTNWPFMLQQLML